MLIALERGRRDGFHRGVPHYAPQLPPPPLPEACGGSSSAGRGSDSQAVAMLGEETEEGGEGEVQSSYRCRPFETMDALQDALPQREEFKFYNRKSSSLVNVVDDLLSPQRAKDLASPENPSPKKRKGLLPFSINQNELQSKELSPVGDVTDSPMNCRNPLYPAVSSPYKSMSGDEHCKNHPCHCLQRRFGAVDEFASPPVALQTQLNSVQMRPVSTGSLQDVAMAIDVVSPKEKRRKN